MIRNKAVSVSCVLLLVTLPAVAGPYVPPGDMVLRHDIQRLADVGVIQGPVTTWPLAWGPILNDIAAADASALPADVVDALVRIKRRAGWETRDHELTFNAKAGFADNAAEIRSFQNTPRGRMDMSAGASYIGDWFSVDLNVQFVDAAQDDEDLRVDDSMLGLVAGNWSISASTMQRWWGPGWDGSLILSNNARPMPAIVVDRVFTDAFESKWLSWIGPWDFSLIFGDMGDERVVPDTSFFGMRVNFRPIPTLEIGLSRSAQWCGDDRPCNVETFVDLFLGRDNRGSSGIDSGNEPGNQLAGLDFRWTPSFMGSSVSAYGQFIGEDEAGGFPSRYVGQLGVEGSGYLRSRWSYRWYAEAASTSCDFWKSDERLNCAYNHSIYQTGYRYRGRAVGHPADNDTRLVSVGWVMVDQDEQQWRALLRYGALNRGELPDASNSLTPTRQDISSFDLSHSRAFQIGIVDIGIGYEKRDDIESGSSLSDGRVYVQWRSSY